MSEIFNQFLSLNSLTEGIIIFCVLAYGYYTLVYSTDKIIDNAWEVFYRNVLEQNTNSDQKLETMIFIAKAMRAGFTLISELLLIIAVALCIIAYTLIRF